MLNFKRISTQFIQNNEAWKKDFHPFKEKNRFTKIAFVT